MSKMNPSVDGYLRKNKAWGEELVRLRAILLECPVVEEIKWRSPCYTFEGNNVVLMGGEKTCCSLGFLKGALLKDAHGVLVKPGANTQSARVMRFTSAQEIARMEAIIKAYVLEAIEVEKAGLKVDFKEKTQLVLAEELTERLEKDPALKAAFLALTPGRQRGYNLYFTAPKQSKTRASRVEKYAGHILKGKGFHDV